MRGNYSCVCCAAGQLDKLPSARFLWSAPWDKLQSALSQYDIIGGTHSNTTTRKHVPVSGGRLYGILDRFAPNRGTWKAFNCCSRTPKMMSVFVGLALCRLAKGVRVQHKQKLCTPTKTKDPTRIPSPLWHPKDLASGKGATAVTSAVC